MPFMKNHQLFHKDKRVLAMERNLILQVEK